jgi:uncharacterized protein YdhG (YjbR/CyaY superfamily)
MKASAKKKASPYGPKKFTTIQEYHESVPPGVKKVLDNLRKIIREVAPKAEETISYNIPTFKLNENLVHYAAFKEHIGFYPTQSPLKIFSHELSAYKTSKGAVQFPIDKPLPITLIKKIVKHRIKEISAKEKSVK